jgi:hypothetical protein
MQGTQGLKVGSLIHLDGHRFDNGDAACVAAIVGATDGQDFYPTIMQSPIAFANGSWPYEGTWHWPEQA